MSIISVTDLDRQLLKTNGNNNHRINSFELCTSMSLLFVSQSHFEFRLNEKYTQTKEKNDFRHSEKYNIIIRNSSL